jgi:hypothetical protein
MPDDFNIEGAPPAKPSQPQAPPNMAPLNSPPTSGKTVMPVEMSSKMAKMGGGRIMVPKPVRLVLSILRKIFVSAPNLLNKIGVGNLIDTVFNKIEDVINYFVDRLSDFVKFCLFWGLIGAMLIFGLQAAGVLVPLPTSLATILGILGFIYVIICVTYPFE